MSRYRCRVPAILVQRMQEVDSCKKRLSDADDLQADAIREWLVSGGGTVTDLGTLMVYGFVKTKEGFFVNDTDNTQPEFHKTENETTNE